MIPLHNMTEKDRCNEPTFQWDQDWYRSRKHGCSIPASCYWNPRWNLTRCLNKPGISPKSIIYSIEQEMFSTNSSPREGRGDNNDSTGKQNYDVLLISISFGWLPGNQSPESARRIAHPELRTPISSKTSRWRGTEALGKDVFSALGMIVSLFAYMALWTEMRSRVKAHTPFSVLLSSMHWAS